MVVCGRLLVAVGPAWPSVALCVVGVSVGRCGYVWFSFVVCDVDGVQYHTSRCEDLPTVTHPPSL